MVELVKASEDFAIIVYKIFILAKLSNMTLNDLFGVLLGYL